MFVFLYLPVDQCQGLLLFEFVFKDALTGSVNKAVKFEQLVLLYLCGKCSCTPADARKVTPLG